MSKMSTWFMDDPFWTFWKPCKPNLKSQGEAVMNFYLLVNFGHHLMLSSSKNGFKCSLFQMTTIHCSMNSNCSIALLMIHLFLWGKEGGDQESGAAALLK